MSDAATSQGVPEATRSRTRPRKTPPESLRREEGPDNTLTPSLQVVGINFCCSKPHSCDNLLRYPRETNASRGSRLPVVLRAGGRPHGNMRVCRDRDRDQLSPCPRLCHRISQSPGEGPSLSGDMACALPTSLHVTAALPSVTQPASASSPYHAPSHCPLSGGSVSALLFCLEG